MGTQIMIATELSAGLSRRAEHHAQLLLGVGDAMRALSVGRTKLYELIASGEIELVKIGSKSCITVASLNEFVERLRVQAHEKAA
jgi:excisionase family DNA binding protein